MKKKVFRSRISVLLMVFFLAIFLPPLIPMIRSGNIFNPAFYILAGTIAFVVLLFSIIRYEITDKELLCKLWKIPFGSFPLSQIASVERSYNPLSSAASSLKRLRVSFHKGYKWPYTLISPAREQEFLDALNKANPDIYIRVINKKGWWRIWCWDI